MAYPICVFIKKSDGSYFQVRDANLALVSEWKWSGTQYYVRDFAIDTLGDVYFAKGDTKVRKHDESGTQVKVKTASHVRYTYETVLNSYGYVCNLQKNWDGWYFSVRGYTKDDNLDYVSPPIYRQLTRNIIYGGLVFEDESIFYASRGGVIEKWTTESAVKLADIDITGYVPINVIFINNYLVFGTTTKLCRISKAGGAVTELSILYDIVTGIPVPPEDGLAITEVHVGRFDDNTFIVAFECTPMGSGNPYKWFIRKYNLAGTQIGNTIDLGEHGYVSLGSYFDVGEVSPSVNSMVAEVLTSSKVVFSANLVNGSGKCVMRGFQFYDVDTPGTIRNITYSAEYYDSGVYQRTQETNIVPDNIYMVRPKAQNAVELVYGEWVEFSTFPVGIQNVRAENSSVFARTLLYGEITELPGSGVLIVERGFEYLIQDNEPADGDSGTEVKELNPSGFAFEEYSLRNKELYDTEEDTVWWFRAYCIDDAANKTVATSWMKNLPTVTTQAVDVINYNKADGNGTIISKGASDLIERGFEVKYIFSDKLPKSWRFDIAGFEGELECVYVTNYLSVVTDILWQGDLIKTVLETAGLVIGIYVITVGQMILGWPLADDCLIEGKDYKCKAFASNEFGRVYGEEVSFSTLSRTFVSESAPTVGETTVFDHATIDNLPEGVTASRRGFRYGTTEAADEFDVHEDGSFTNGPYSLLKSDLLPDTTYYSVPYIVVDGTTYEGDSVTIITDPEGLEDEDEYPTPHFSPHGQDYREISTKVFAEVSASQGIIDFSGGKKTLPITNHLIQANLNARTIAGNYLDRFKLAKTRMEVQFPTPLPFEREDTVDFSYGVLLFKEDDEGIVFFKEDGEGVSVLMDQISMIIKKINSVGLTKTEESIEYVAELDLEHE